MNERERNFLNLAKIQAEAVAENIETVLREAATSASGEDGESNPSSNVRGGTDGPRSEEGRAPSSPDVPQEIGGDSQVTHPFVPQVPDDAGAESSCEKRGHIYPAPGAVRPLDCVVCGEQHPDASVDVSEDCDPRIRGIIERHAARVKRDFHMDNDLPVFDAWVEAEDDLEEALNLLGPARPEAEQDRNPFLLTERDEWAYGLGYNKGRGDEARAWLDRAPDVTPDATITYAERDDLAPAYPGDVAEARVPRHARGPDDDAGESPGQPSATLISTIIAEAIEREGSAIDFNNWSPEDFAECAVRALRGVSSAGHAFVLGMSEAEAHFLMHLLWITAEQHGEPEHDLHSRRLCDRLRGVVSQERAE